MTQEQRRESKHNPATIASLIARMKRIEGQARGIQRLLSEEKDCQSIIIQLSAMKSALNKVALNVIGCYVAEQISEEIRQGNTGEEAIERSIKIFSKFS